MLQLLPDFDLQPYSALALEAKARLFADIRAEEDLLEALKLAKQQQLPVMPLGEGSNIVLSQDYPGLVLRILLSGIEEVDENRDFIWLKVGAGQNWHQLVEHCLAFHYWGLENLSLIPGSVGAAPIQNIGAYGVELRDLLAELEAVEIKSGVKVVFQTEACRFGYRDSVFKQRLKDKYIITSVTFKLCKEPQLQIDYPALKAALAAFDDDKITPQIVSDTICQIRRSKLPDPAEIPNVGSFFKNPVIDRESLSTLQADYPDLPVYVVDEQRVKLAAGWLIERAGWKGKRLGKVAVHDQQALVLTNTEQGSGRDILALAQAVRESVKAKFAIELEQEPRTY